MEATLPVRVVRPRQRAPRRPAAAAAAAPAVALQQPAAFALVETPAENAPSVALMETPSIAIMETPSIMDSAQMDTPETREQLDGGRVRTSDAKMRGSDCRSSTDSRKMLNSFLIPMPPRMPLTTGQVVEGEIGLLINYLAVGVMLGFTQAMLYPFLKIYLNQSEFRAVSAEMWVALPWMFKPVFAFICDCFPIHRLRRMPFIFMGWAQCFLFLLIIVCQTETPFAKNGVPSKKAISSGNNYVAFLILAIVGVVTADAACDGMVVEYTKNEHQDARGTLLLLSLAARNGGHAATTFIVAFLSNGTEFGGTFGWGLTLNILAALPLLASLVALIATRFYVVEKPQRRTRNQPTRVLEFNDEDASESTSSHEDKEYDPDSIRGNLMSLWEIVQGREVWQLLVVMLVMRVCWGFYPSTAKVLYLQWMDVGLLLSNFFNGVTSVVFMVTAIILQRSCLKTSWKRLVVVSTLLSTVITVTSSLLSVYDLLRAPLISLVTEQAVVICEAVVTFVLLLAAIEATASPYEATTLAFFTTIGNAALPFAASLSHIFGPPYDPNNSEWQQETTVRWKVMSPFVVCVIVRALGLVVLPWLPEHCEGIWKLRDEGARNRMMTIAITGASAFVVAWALFIALLGAFKASACSAIAGGDGC